MPGEFLVELPRNIANAFWAVAIPVWNAGTVASEFTFKTLRAHFNVIARYTAPIEKELLKTKPPKPKELKELNILGQIALFPLIILSWLLAATIAPLIYNSVVLFLVGFIRSFNLSLLDKPESQLPLPEGEMPWYRLIFGLPGLILGATFGLGLAGIVVFFRLCKESFFSAASIVMSAVNLASDPEDESKDWGLENDTREAHEIYGFGLIGLAVGIPFSSLAYLTVGFVRMFPNSWENIKRISVLTYNLVRHEYDPVQAEFKRSFSGFRQYGLGSPGLVLGLTLMPFVIIVAAAERMAIQSWDRIKLIVANFVFEASSPSKQKKKVEPETVQELSSKNNWDHYFFSLPGIPAGALAGIVGFLAVIVSRSLKNSWKTTKNLTYSGVNLVRHDNDQEIESLENDKRSFLRKYIFGFPGLVLGSFTVLVAISYETLRRFGIESRKTGKTVSEFIQAKVPYFTADELDEKESAENSSEEGDRSTLDKAFFGGPGFLIGGIWGAILFTKDITTHISKQSWKSLKNTVVLITNLGLHGDDKITALDLLADQRSTKQIYGFGLPGIILGGLVGSLGLLSAAFGWNSIVTAKEIILTSIDAVGEEEPKDPRKPDSRPLISKYLLGFPGFVLGSLSATVVVLLLGTKKIAKQSWETGIEIVNLMADEIRPEDEEKTEATEPVLTANRTNFNRFVFGGLGILPGLFIGSGFFAFYFGKRTFKESYETAKRVVYSGMNLIRHDDEQILEDLEHDTKRRLINKYGFGFPGLLLGAVITVFIAIPIAIARRAAIESWLSGKAVYSAIVENPPEEQVSIQEEAALPKKRSFADQYFFGALGLLLGAVAGVFSKTAIETVDNTKIAFIKITVSTLDENEETEFLRLLMIENRKRTFAARYLWGFFGSLIGGLSGLIASTIIIAVKFIIHNFSSFCALSGSLLNGSLNKAQFTGLSGDGRTADKKVAGTLGYVLALAITFPISLVIFTFKKALPVVSALLVSLTVSPIVAFIKGISLAVEEPRFENQELDEKLQPFKNIYSSLTIWGKLPEGEQIAENQTGQKGAQSFIRKAVTLNTSTLDETILNKMLAAFKAWKGTPEQFFGADGDYKRVLKETKGYYSATNCLLPDSEIQERENQIDAIGKFVKKYILGKQKQVPEHLYSDSIKTWSANFWGAKLENQRIELDDLAARKAAKVSPVLA